MVGAGAAQGGRGNIAVVEEVVGLAPLMEIVVPVLLEALQLLVEEAMLLQVVLLHLLLLELLSLLLLLLLLRVAPTWYCF